MFRHGYQTCSSCHISPSGGGVLTQYGRSLSEEVLSTFSYKDEGQLGHFNTGMPSWLALGGDLRNTWVGTETDANPTYRFIPMQRDLEAAIGYGPTWIGASWGIYNDKVSESRRVYLVLPNIAEHFSLRVGKFTPAYGINFPDHTIYSRGKLELGEGSESWNIEGTVRGSSGEIFITGIGASKSEEASAEANAKGKASVYSKENQGIAARVNWFAHKKLQIGASLKTMTKDLTYGGFFQTAPYSWLYVAYDLNTLEDRTSRALFSYGKISSEVFKGVSLFYENNYSKSDSQTRENNFGLQVYPRPHLEFIGKYGDSGGYKNYVMMAHYYL